MDLANLEKSVNFILSTTLGLCKSVYNITMRYVNVYTASLVLNITFYVELSL